VEVRGAARILLNRPGIRSALELIGFIVAIVVCLRIIVIQMLD
jgi:hypothetical protein